MAIFSSKSKYDYIIVGLGNPGDKYAGTRHNVGWMCIDRLAKDLEAGAEKEKFKSAFYDAKIKDKTVMLCKPLTFMNCSGQAVSEIINFYKMKPSQVIVISDDVSMDVGRLRIRSKGSAGGHNGLKDIIELTGTDEIARVKIGVGKKPNPEYDLASWVLGKFGDGDKQLIETTIKLASDAVKSVVVDGAEKSMSKFNR